MPRLHAFQNMIPEFAAHVESDWKAKPWFTLHLFLRILSEVFASGSSK